MLLGQLLTGHGGSPNGGHHVLAELLASISAQQGLDSAAVAARTGEMVYGTPEGGSNGSASRGGASAASAAAGAEEVTCMVCLEGFKPGESLRILPCLHRYHKNCVDPWLARNRHCPICKHDVTQ